MTSSTVPFNLYISRIFENHPLAVWGLDDNIHYASAIPDSARNMSNWIPENCSLVLAESPADYPHLPAPFDFPGRLSTLTPTASATEFSIALLGTAKWSHALDIDGLGGLDDIWDEVKTNYPDWQSLLYDEVAVPVSVGAIKNSVAASFFIWSTATNIEKYTIRLRYKDKLSLTFQNQDYEVPFEFPFTWEKVLGSFNLENVYGGFTVSLIFTAKAGTVFEDTNPIYVGGVNIGQWSETFCHSYDGVIPETLPGELDSRWSTTYDSDIEYDEDLSYAGNYVDGVPLKSYFTEEDNGYVLTLNGELLARHDGIPMIYGSGHTTHLDYPIDLEGVPSMIIPDMGFLTEAGKYNETTLEFWLRLKNFDLNEFRIVGPLDSADGLYVEEGFLTLRVGSQYGSYYVGKWYRPMLVSMRYSPARTSLLINGEEVITLNLTDSDIDTLIDENWIGFYCQPMTFPMELDCIAVYPYYQDKEIAKKNYVYGQGVQKTNLIDQNFLGETVQFDFPFSKYSVDFKYPDSSKWKNGFSSNLTIGNRSISPPIYKLPDIVLADEFINVWETSMFTLNDPVTAASSIYVTFGEDQGFIHYPTYSQLNDQTKLIYVSVDDNTVNMYTDQAPTLASQGTLTYTNSSVTSLAVNMPSGIEAGDLLVMWAEAYQTNKVFSCTGWTKILACDTTGGIQYACLAKIAAGGDTATLLSAVASGMAVQCFRFTNHGVANIATDIKVSTESTAYPVPGYAGVAGKAPVLEMDKEQPWYLMTAGFRSVPLDGFSANTILTPEGYTMLSSHEGVWPGLYQTIAIAGKKEITDSAAPANQNWNNSSISPYNSPFGIGYDSRTAVVAIPPKQHIGPILTFKNEITGSYLKYVIEDRRINVYLSLNGDTPTIIYAHTLPIGKVDIGIDIDKFISYYARQLRGFLLDQQAIGLYIGGIGTESFTGNIYGVGFNNRFYTDTYFESQDNGFHIKPTVDFISNYQLTPTVENGRVTFDIGISGYWKSALPLSFFAKYVTGADNRKYLDLDMIQLNVDAVTPSLRAAIDVADNTYGNIEEIARNLELSYSWLMHPGLQPGSQYDLLLYKEVDFKTASEADFSIKPYITFNNVADGIDDLEHFENLEAVSINRVLNVNDYDWESTKFYFIDGTIIYPPNTTSFKSTMMCFHIKMDLRKTLRRAIAVNSLEACSLAFDNDSFYNIGTKYGSQVYPVSKSGLAYLTKTLNPFLITKESAPYLYLTESSGIQVLPEATFYERGIYIPINKDRAPRYKLGAVRIWMRYEYDNFATVPVKIFEINANNVRCHGYLIQDADTNRARIFLYDPDTRMESDNIRYVQEDNEVFRPYLVAGRWVSLSFVFGKDIDMSSTEGSLILMPGMTFQNVGIFQASNEAVQNLSFRSIWDDYETEQWLELFDSGERDWSDVYRQINKSSYYVDGALLYKSLIGTESITTPDDGVATVNQSDMLFYQDIAFQNFILRPGEPLDSD